MSNENASPVAPAVPASQTPPDAQTAPVVDTRYAVTPAPQPVPAQQTPVVDEQEARIREFQSQAEKHRIEAAKAAAIAEQARRDAEALRQQMMQLQQGMFQPQQQIPADPYSPEYQAMVRQQELAQLKQELLQATQQSQQQFVQNLAEMAFIQKNPTVDIMSLKAFMRSNGIAEWNLDAGLRLMNPTPAQQYQTPVAPIQPQQFNQPVQGIGAIRNGVGAVGQPVQLSLEKMLADYRANPAVESTWSPELQQMFWTHVQNTK